MLTAAGLPQITITVTVNAAEGAITDEETFGIIWLGGMVISHHLASKVVNQA
jgi:hypothetical protein